MLRPDRRCEREEGGPAGLRFGGLRGRHHHLSTCWSSLDFKGVGAQAEGLRASRRQAQAEDLMPSPSKYTNRAPYFMVGITYSAPWRMPVGQRDVTVFILV